MNNRKLTKGRKSAGSFNESSLWHKGAWAHNELKILDREYKSLKKTEANLLKLSKADPEVKKKLNSTRVRMKTIRMKVKALYPVTHTQKIAKM